MRILIAGGGTGGHIYPAIAIADAIKKSDPQSVIEFVGTANGLETILVPKAGYKINFIPIGRLNKNVSVIERIKTILQMPMAFYRSIILTYSFHPDVVLGVGGYASGPIVLIAALLGKRVYIWEPNAFPGLANRMLSRFVSECLVVFEEAKKHLKNKKIRHVHMPVRAEIENSKIKVTHSVDFQVLVFGGSQGARPINNALAEAILKGGNWLSNVKIIHQTGSADFARIREQYLNSANAKQHVEVFEYLYDMPERYAHAKLVIARAGAGTISELAASGKASLLIPLPSAADDHQTKNAQALVQIGGAHLLPQKELTPERLIQEILFFKNNPEQVAQFESNIKRFHKPQAAQEIAQLLLEQAKAL